MLTKKLYSITIFGKNVEKEETISTLQQLGVLHITETDLNEGFMKKDVPMPGVDQISHLLLKLQYIAKETGVTKKFHLEGMPPFAKILQQSEEFVEKHITKIKELSEKKKKKLSEKAKFEAHLNLLKELPFLVKPLKTKTNKDFIELVLSSKKNLKNLKSLLPITSLITKNKTGKKYYYLIKVEHKNLSTLKQLLTKNMIKIVNLEFLKYDSKQDQKFISEKLSKIESDLKSIEKDLFRKINGKQSKINFLISSLANYREQFNITRFFSKSSHFFALKAYCEGKEVNRIKDSLPEASIYVNVADNNAPTKLANGPFGSNFEMVTNMYATPTYGLVDPTKMIAFFFPFFFGFMLSDIGYGLVLLAGILALRYHFKEKFAKASIIFGTSAISAIIFGVLFGSFFGNLISIEPLFADSFTASFTILKIALVVGLIHLNLGIALNIYQYILKKEKFLTILQKAGAYPLIQLLVISLIFKQSILAILIGVVLIIILWKEKGLFGFMDITGFFGQWFSYARLLALSLATAGVALAVNIIAQKALNFGKLGVVLWLVILLFGHIFNFVLSVIGCTVNSARLHYVEFFSIFFDGKGYPFKPFKIKKSFGEDDEEEI